MPANSERVASPAVSSSPDMSTGTPASDELEARVRALEAETIAAREALEAATPTLPEIPASSETPAGLPEPPASDETPAALPEPPASDETPAVLPEPPASDVTPAVLPEPPASDAAPTPPEPTAASLLVASDDPAVAWSARSVSFGAVWPTGFKRPVCPV